MDPRGKARKKLQIFVEKSFPAPKRSKALGSFISLASEDEVAKLFKDSCFYVYQTFLDSMSAYEANFRRGKHALSEKDIRNIAQILKGVLKYLKDLVKKNWQVRSIVYIIEKFLFIENTHAVRMLGFELLLLFLETIETPDKFKLALLTTSLNFQAFVTDYHNREIKFSSTVISVKDPKLFVFLPSSTPPTKQETEEMFELFLHFIGDRLENFRFWFDLLKNQFLLILFPSVCKRMGLLPANNDTGFTEYAPHELQVKLILHLSSWISNPTVFAFFVNAKEKDSNIPLLLEIFRQGVRLPLHHAEVIKKLITSAQKMFLCNLDPEGVLGDRLFEYQQFVFVQLQYVMQQDTGSLEKEHESLGLFIIDVFKSLVGMYQNLHPKTKELTLFAMLHNTGSLMKSSQKFLIKALGDNMVEALLFCWIKAKERRAEVWEKFFEGLEGMFHHMQTAVQLRIKILQLTLLIKELMYPLSERKIQKKLKDMRNMAKGGDPRSIDFVVPPPEVVKDTEISNIPWDIDTVQWTWNCLNQALRHVNLIKDPAIHEAALNIIVEEVDILLRAEEDLDFADYESGSLPPQLSLMNIFGPRLFEACNLDSKYIKGKAHAYASLCRLVCRFHPPYPQPILTHFYNTINNGLFLPPIGGIDLSWGIIQNSSNIFNLALDGAHVLIPCFLYRIKHLFRTREVSVPLDVRKKCITIINSLICYPNHFPNMEVPTQIERGKLVGKNFKIEDLKLDIGELLSTTLKTDKNVENRTMCIWGLTVLLIEEILHGAETSTGLVKDIWDALIPQTVSSEHFVARAALDAMSLLTLIHEKLDVAFLSSLLCSLANNIIKVLRELDTGSSSIPEPVIANYFHCMTDWMTCDGNAFFDNPDFATFRSLLFEGIQLALQMVTTKQDTPAEAPPAPEEHKLTRHLSKMKIVGKGSLKAKGGVDMDEMEDEKGGNSQPPAAPANTIKDAAQTLLAHLLKFVHNFPSVQGSEVVSSQLDELDDRDPAINGTPVFTTFGDNMLISICEVPNPDKTKPANLTRLFVRDPMGRYAWNFEIVYNNENLPQKQLHTLLGDQHSDVTIDNEVYKFSAADALASPAKPALSNSLPPDKLSELLASLGTHPECLPETGESLREPLAFTALPKATFTQSMEKIADFVKAEQDYVLPNQEGNGYVENKAPPEPTNGVSPMHVSRIFMSHFGFMDVTTSQSRTALIDFSNKFERSLAQLDITSEREILKIGVIYVKHAQDDQKDILRNDNSSTLYREFVDALGWPVDLKTHRGYMGGLDKKLTTGTVGPYYSNATMETIFHDITLMPTNENDPQQIHKKRHVGNDIVHIIWSEHERDYSPTTITSQFNDAHIVIYPLKNGLFRIQSFRKESKVPIFGPLLHGMVVNKQLLKILVRPTSINAYRYVRYNTQGYSKPYVLRNLRIAEIMGRYKTKSDYEDLIQTIAQKPQEKETRNTHAEPVTPGQ